MLELWLNIIWIWSSAPSRLVLPSKDYVKNVMANVWSVTPTCVRALWYAYVMSVTMALTRRCVIWGGPGVSDAYYCKECTVQAKDRDGCPKIVNLGSFMTLLFYERKRYGFKKRRLVGGLFSHPPPDAAAVRKDGDHHRAEGGESFSTGPSPPFLLLPWHVIGIEKESLHNTLGRPEQRKMDRLAHSFSWIQETSVYSKLLCSLYPKSCFFFLF